MLCILCHSVRPDPNGSITGLLHEHIAIIRFQMKSNVCRRDEDAYRLFVCTQWLGIIIHVRFVVWISLYMCMFS